MWKNNKRTYNPKSLQSLLIYRLFLVLVMVLIGLGTYQYSSMKQYLVKSKIELLDSRFKNVEKEVVLATNNNEMLVQNMEYILNVVSGEDICVAVINEEGKIIGETNRYKGIRTEINKGKNKILEIPQLNEEIYLKTINDSVTSSEYYIIEDKNEQKQLVILREIGTITHPSGLVQISTSTDDIESILEEQVRVYLLSAVMALLLSGLLGKMILKHTLKPLKRLTREIDVIDENQLDTRTDVHNGQIEIDILANKFNNMIERLEVSFEKERKTNVAMKNFILDVSHELRTPLTSIQGFIEVLQLGASKNEEQLKMALESMMTESRRLGKLVNELLLLMKLEGNVSVELKRENINDIIKEIKSQLEILKRDRNLEIEWGNDMYCMVNKDQVKQIIYNLVQNAINHTDEQIGIIKITTRRINKENSSWIEVSITDNGEGVSKEDIELIFDRFYRVDKNRSRKRGGYGLGLSIVKRIICNHNGEIQVQSEKGKGSTFSFLLREIESDS